MRLGKENWSTRKKAVQAPLCKPQNPHDLTWDGRALAQAASHRGGPGSTAGHVMWDLWSTKWHWGRFPQSISVSPANSHSTDCSTLIIYHLGLVQYASGRRIKWTQVSPYRKKLKKQKAWNLT
jgi:hypothetical protein